MENKTVDQFQQSQVMRSKTPKKVHFRSVTQDGNSDTMEDRHNLLQCLNWQCCAKHGCITDPYGQIEWRTLPAQLYINRTLPAANLGVIYHSTQKDKETASKQSLITIPTITLTTDQNINGRPKMDHEEIALIPEIARTTASDEDPHPIQDGGQDGDQDQDTRSPVLQVDSVSESVDLPTAFMGSGLLLDDSTSDLDEPHLHDDAVYSFNNLPPRTIVENQGHVESRLLQLQLN